jgi:hypothetical protein
MDKVTECPAFEVRLPDNADFEPESEDNDDEPHTVSLMIFLPI